jgi:fatty acid desaturase
MLSPLTKDFDLNTITEAVPSQTIAHPLINDEKPTPTQGLKALGIYQQELKAKLPEAIFKRTPMRAFHLLAFIGLNAAIIYAVTQLDLAWPLKLVLAIMMGHFNAGMAFIAHETLHGGIVKTQWLQNLIGSIGFAPFLVSQTYWRFWHNTLHHGNTQLIYKDPDAFPTMSVYKRSKFMRVVFELAPGSKNPLSYFYLFYWFSLQSIMNQTYMRFGNKMWDKMNHKRVTLEMIPVYALAAGYLYFVGFSHLLWLVVIPLMIQNYVVLSYILTNHNLSPLTKINDPLENSLTVTTNKFWDTLHLNFGYHVEHHLFPRVSGKHTKKIHEALKANYPEKYKHMPKIKALKMLYKTPRIYKNATELIHPKTLETHPTLQ